MQLVKAPTIKRPISNTQFYSHWLPNFRRPIRENEQYYRSLHFSIQYYQRFSKGVAGLTQPTSNEEA